MVFWAWGFFFAFGGDHKINCQTCNGFIGSEGPFLIGVPSHHFVFFFFEYTIGTVAVGIVSNAVIERLHFPGYFTVSLFMTGVVYPVVCQ